MTNGLDKIVASISTKDAAPKLCIYKTSLVIPPERGSYLCSNCDGQSKLCGAYHNLPYKRTQQ